jgi:hypothetical protein
VKTQTGGRYYDLIALFENQSLECAQKPNLIIVLYKFMPHISIYPFTQPDCRHSKSSEIYAIT